jgi:hypothetical protein
MILAIALALGAQAGADRWVVFSDDGDLVNSVDTGAIQAEGDRRIVWHRVDFGTPLDQGVTTALFRVEVDCTRRTTALLSGATRNASGAIVQSHEIDTPRARAVEPESVGADLVAFVCRNPA